MEIYFINDIHINDYIPTSTGFSNIAKYKKFLEVNTLPADVLCIAGDISHDVVGEVNTLIAASKLFEKVIYVNGNSELICIGEESNINSIEKLEKIAKFVKTKTKSKQVIRLDGDTVFHGGISFTGTMGMPDATYGMNKHKGVTNWDAQTSFNEGSYRKWKWWTNDFFQLSEHENDKVMNLDCNSDIIMTHYAPLSLVNPDKHPHIDDMFLTYDSKDFIKKIMDNAIYHYGHIHTKDKRIIKNKNGQFLLINNSIGRKKDKMKTKKFIKSDFLIKL